MTDLDQQIRDVQAEMVALDEGITEIRSQIDHARARRFNGGNYADPEWWARANAALRHKGRRRQVLQNQLGDLNRQRRAANRIVADREQETTFIAAAKSLLTGSMFAEIWAEVERRKAAQ